MINGLLHSLKMHSLAESYSRAKEKRSDISEFYRSQFYCGLNDDKKGISELLKTERKNEKTSMRRIGKGFRWHSISYGLLENYVPFQYMVEMFDRYHDEFKIPDRAIQFLYDGMDDLILSVRGAMSGHYRSGYFHLRSFIENYFELIWSFCEEEGYLNHGKLRKYREGSIVPRMRYFSTFGEYKKEDCGNRFSVDYFFNGHEFEKLYNFLSESVHVRKKTNDRGFNANLEFNSQELDNFCRVGGIAMLMVSRMMYGFFSDKVEECWIRPLLKRVPGEMNYYRYVIGGMMKSDIYIFNLLYEREEDRAFFLGPESRLKFDIKQFYPDAEWKMKEYDMLDVISKETRGDKNAYIERVIAYEDSTLPKIKLAKRKELEEMQNNYITKKPVAD